MLKGNARLAAAAAAVVGVSVFSSIALAQTPIMDGTLDAGSYGTPFATQTVQTQFGDNQSEIDAGYARIENGKLYMFIAGNLESNNNKLVFFFDTKAGGQNVMRTDNPDVSFNQLNDKYGGMTHDTGFEPDYLLAVSRDRPGGAEGSIYVDFSELNTDGGGTGGYSGRIDVPANQITSGTSSGGNNRGVPSFNIGYNDANVAGVGGGSNALDPAGIAAAQAVTTGFEVVIDLPQIAALGNFTVVAGINGSSHDYWSNQFLNGLPTPGGTQGNLGGDGTGGFNGTVGAINFANFYPASDQFSSFTYAAPAVARFDVASGIWSQGANWTGGISPNRTDARAQFGVPSVPGSGTATLDTNVTVQQLTFTGLGSYTILPSGTNTLTVSGAATNSSILVSGGNHTIAAPLVLGPTTKIEVVGSLQSLTITGAVSAVGQTIRKVGPGLVQFPNVIAGHLAIDAGTVKIGANGTNAGVSNVQLLSIGGGDLPIAKLDITNNGFIVDYAVVDPQTSPIDTIRTQIIAGRAGGNWSGNGITSSTAAANSGQFGIGYAEASQVGGVSMTFMGNTVDTTAVVFRYTRLGDTNLDGTVNLDDFTALAAGFGSGTSWFQGDSNYDGLVNLDDFTALAANFGSSAPGDAPRSSVPEPTALSLLAVATMGLARRRRA